MVHRSVWAIRFGCRTLADKSGRKKNSIEFVESLFLKQPVASAKLVTDTISNYRNSCNLDHQLVQPLETFPGLHSFIRGSVPSDTGQVQQCLLSVK